MRLQAWLLYSLILIARCLLAAVMVIVRVKGISLPCGSALGCMTAIHRSPAILGLHLTEYALLFAILTFGLALANPRLRPVLLVVEILGAIASFASNGYEYVVHNNICVYCLSFALLCFAGLTLLCLTKPPKINELRGHLNQIGIIGGLAASATFLWLKFALISAIKVGAVVGVPIPTILQSGNLVLGNPKSHHQVVCFYSPSCQVCKDDIRDFVRLAANKDVCIRLRACVADVDSAGLRLAIYLETIAETQGVQPALEFLQLPSDDSDFLAAKGTSTRSAASVVEQDHLVAKALNINQTPTCILIEDSKATYVPCSELARGRVPVIWDSSGGGK